MSIKKLSALLSAAALSAAAPANATIIDFNELSVDTSGGAGFVDSVTEDGFSFTSLFPKGNDFLIWDKNTSYNADPFGGNTLGTNYQGITTVLKAVDGSKFTLGSVDLAGIYNSTADTEQDVVFTLDTINGLIEKIVHVDAQPGLQTYAFNIDNISSINITSKDNFYQSDNWNVSKTAVAAVPEPATWGLMLVSMGAVGASMRRRKSTPEAAPKGFA